MDHGGVLGPRGTQARRGFDGTLIGYVNLFNKAVGRPGAGHPKRPGILDSQLELGSAREHCRSAAPKISRGHPKVAVADRA